MAPLPLGWDVLLIYISTMRVVQVLRATLVHYYKLVVLDLVIKCPIPKRVCMSHIAAKQVHSIVW
jgi:hypothetical protein